MVKVLKVYYTIAVCSLLANIMFGFSDSKCRFLKNCIPTMHIKLYSGLWTIRSVRGVELNINFRCQALGGLTTYRVI